MIAEPYICISNDSLAQPGEIHWLLHDFGEYTPNRYWQRYADFEREKLRTLTAEMIELSFPNGWTMFVHHKEGVSLESSDEMIGYSYGQWERDIESNRLLKRAEFLEAVCEKEGVPFLSESPKAEKCEHDFSDCDPRGKGSHGKHCCKCGECKGCWLRDNKPEEKPYSRAEISEKILAILERHHETHRGIQEEEREWRRWLLDFLYDNMAFSKNRKARIDGLRSRFL